VLRELRGRLARGLGLALPARGGGAPRGDGLVIRLRYADAPGNCGMMSLP
jgi:hypothetical protein